MRFFDVPVEPTAAEETAVEKVKLNNTGVNYGINSGQLRGW